MRLSRLTLILSALLTLGAASCRKNAPTSSRMYVWGETVTLKGHLRRMTIGADTPNTLFYNQFDFNKDGNLTYFKNFSADLSTIRSRTSNALHTSISRYKYIFDKNGTKRTAFAYIQSDSSFTSKYEFDTKGNLIKFIPNMGDSSNYIAHYRYDKTGNMMEAVSGTVKSRSKISARYKYNTNGDVIGLDYYEGNSAIVKLTMFYKEFDLHKNWTKVISIRNNLNSHQTFKDSISRTLAYY